MCVKEMIYPHDFKYTSNSDRLKRWHASLNKQSPSQTKNINNSNNNNNALNVNALNISEKRFRALQLIGLVDSDLLNCVPASHTGRPTLIRMIGNQCERYCSNSSIHGMKYLVDSSLGWFERYECEILTYGYDRYDVL